MSKKDNEEFEEILRIMRDCQKTNKQDSFSLTDCPQCGYKMSWGMQCFWGFVCMFAIFGVLVAFVLWSKG